MITLTELLHSIKADKKENKIKVDSWRLPDVEHLHDMGFEFGDEYHMHTPKTPKITIYRKRESDENGKDAPFFYVEEKERETKRFKDFNDVIDYFDHYEQPDIDSEI